MRTIIDISKQHIQLLNTVSKSQGVSRAEVIRRAVAEYLRKLSASLDKDAFGLWKNRKLDPQDYQRKMRAEWDR